MKKLPRIYIYSESTKYYVCTNDTLAWGLTMAKSFPFFSIKKYFYLRSAREQWRHTASDWGFKRIQHIEAEVGVKAGRIGF